MKADHRATFFQSLRLIKENLAAFLFILGVFAAIVSGSLAIGASWVDGRVALRTDPMQDILMWQLTKRGELQEYLQHKAQMDSTGKALEIRETSRLLPRNSWQRSN